VLERGVCSTRRLDGRTHVGATGRRGVRERGDRAAAVRPPARDPVAIRVERVRRVHDRGARRGSTARTTSCGGRTSSPPGGFRHFRTGSGTPGGRSIPRRSPSASAATCSVATPSGGTRRRGTTRRQGWKTLSGRLSARTRSAPSPSSWDARHTSARSTCHLAGHSGRVAWQHQPLGQRRGADRSGDTPGTRT
jgi:hypothetical protein